MPEQVKKEIVKEPNKELEAYKVTLREKFNERFNKLNEAAKNATNVWDRLSLEERIKECSDLYKLVFDIK